MTDYGLHATCPACGGDLNPGDTDIVTSTLSVADARCVDCHARWTLGVTATLTEPGLPTSDHRTAAERAVARAVDGLAPVLGL